MAYVDTRVSSDSLRRRLRRLTIGERIEEAQAFIALFGAESGLSPNDVEVRRRSVLRELRRTGTYHHTREELAFGARVAWRNHARCIGRLHWKSLEVFDCRELTDPDAIAGQMAEHMRFAASGERMRSAISIFAPADATGSVAYIENSQITQYAGYLEPDGVIGDPQNIELTRTAIGLGWGPPATRGPFDLLPLIIRDGKGQRRAYRLPSGAAHEVPISHSGHPKLSELGLRWYAVPCVSDMILTIGGVEYPCAPFNGHYMSTEIACRNLIDPYRYNRLERVAEALGLSPLDPFWRDTAAVELNRAVLSSFRDHGVTMVDPHEASSQYMSFVTQENAAGRIASGDWDWITPPLAASTCPVFHEPMQNANDVPNFYRSRLTDGRDLHVSRLTEHRTRLARSWDRARRRWRAWRRRTA